MASAIRCLNQNSPRYLSPCITVRIWIKQDRLPFPEWKGCRLHKLHRRPGNGLADTMMLTICGISFNKLIYKVPVVSMHEIAQPSAGLFQPIIIQQPDLCASA